MYINLSSLKEGQYQNVKNKLKKLVSKELQHHPWEWPDHPNMGADQSDT